MKKIVLAIAILAMTPALIVSAQTKRMTAQQNQAQQMQMMQGPGPAISGSANYNQLPEKAKKFIDTNFKGVNVMNIEKEFADGEFDVTLANGVEIDFNAKGDMKDIKGLNAPLVFSVVKAILPEAATKTLETKSVHNSVKSIEVKKSCYEVEFVKSMNLNLKEMKFDANGKTLKEERR